MKKIENAINKILSRLWISQNTVLHKIGNSLYNLACFAYKILYYPSRSEFSDAVDTYGHKADKQNKKICIRHMRHDWMCYGISPKHYFTFNFSHKTRQEKKNYVSDIDTGKYSAILNDRIAKSVLDHKYQSYLKYKKFYKREVIRSQDVDAQFLSRHPRFFFKPENSKKGLGSRIVSVEEYPDIESMKDAIPEWDNGICEELIIQDGRMGAFHPESINTIRTQTLLKRDGTVSLFGTVLKMGRGNGITDNIASGGIVADVDTKTGIVVSAGGDNWGHSYLTDPDSGAAIEGAVIPRWEEACQIAIEIAEMTPSVRYISLDLALTKNGWALVEGNSGGDFLRQICNHRGYKNEFNHLIES